jgi:hypothetical protein
MYKETVIVYTTCNIRIVLSKKCWMAIFIYFDYILIMAQSLGVRLLGSNYL